MGYRLKHRAEYAAVRGLAGLFCLVPYRVAMAVGAGLAWVAFCLVRFRRADAEGRIREVFGDRLTPRQVRRIAWLSMRNAVFTGVEIMRVPVMTKEWLGRIVDAEAATAFWKTVEGCGGGAILAVPHMGNWELAGLAAAHHGIRLFLVTGRQKNPLTDAYLNRMRGFTGIETIPKDDPMLLRKVVRNLKDGKVLAFTNDLRSRTEGLPIRFLGKPANLVPGMAVFARQAAAPVFPAIVTREGWTRHHCRALDPVWAERTKDRQADWICLTQKVMSEFEKAILAEPEQYFWYNKRWVLDPWPDPNNDPGQSRQKSETRG